MKILVLSDTHGDIESMRACLALVPDADVLLHAGDFYEDGRRLSQFSGLKAVGVTGNCDFMVNGPVEEMLATGGKKIYLTHGHIYRVKQGFNLLIQRARALGAHVAVFGHTHCPVVFEKGGILFVNPGSPHSPRMGSLPSCAVIELSRNSAQARILEVRKTG